MSFQSFRKRTLSSFSGKKRDSSLKPLPPPRSLPTTFRKPRKNVGDVVFVSSSSKVYLEFRDDNYDYACLRRQTLRFESGNDETAFDKKSESVYVNVLDANTKGNVAKLMNRFYVGALESQEINCYIGKLIFSEFHLFMMLLIISCILLQLLHPISTFINCDFYINIGLINKYKFYFS